VFIAILYIRKNIFHISIVEKLIRRLVIIVMNALLKYVLMAFAKKTNPRT